MKVREIQITDIEPLLDYWFTADEDFLLSMGVDVNLMPERDQFKQMLLNQIDSDYTNKKAYCLIWEYNGRPVGHCNVNPLEFGNEAYMHLHMWQRADRQKGLGNQFVKLSTPFFFDKLKLKKLISLLI